MAVNPIKNFLNYVEIGTKTASLIPFLVAAGYVLFRYGFILPKQTLVFFAAMLLFDMTTTAINNHIGDRQTGRTPHYSSGVSAAIIFVMGLGAAGIGLYLVSISCNVILLAGIICFAVGVTYSFGPLPISRTPFGEIVSGTVMGASIPFIVVQLNNPLVEIAPLGFTSVVITAEWVELLAFAIAIAPLVLCIALIMLTNNICDVEEDLRVKRYTLPVCIGVKKSLVLFRLLYAAVYVIIVVAVVARIVPLLALLVLLTSISVRKNIKRFMELQDKRRTFIISVLNFLMIGLTYAACVWLGWLLFIR